MKFEDALIDQAPLSSNLRHQGALQRPEAHQITHEESQCHWWLPLGLHHNVMGVSRKVKNSFVTRQLAWKEILVISVRNLHMNTLAWLVQSKLRDAMIAQWCYDRSMELITRNLKLNFSCSFNWKYKGMVLGALLELKGLYSFIFFWSNQGEKSNKGVGTYAGT